MNVAVLSPVGAVPSRAGRTKAGTLSLYPFTESTRHNNRNRSKFRASMSRRYWIEILSSNTVGRAEARRTPISIHQYIYIRLRVAFVQESSESSLRPVLSGPRESSWLEARSQMFIDVTLIHVYMYILYTIYVGGQLLRSLGRTVKYSENASGNQPFKV